MTNLSFYTLEVLLLILKLVTLLVTIAYYTLAERKIMAAAQRRFGPNVVGYWGLLQPLADGLKLAAKELIIPTHASSGLFILAPLSVLTLAFVGWAVLPFGLVDISSIVPPETAISTLLIGKRLFVTIRSYGLVVKR